MDKIKLPVSVKEFLTSSKFLNTLYFILFTFAMTLIISSQNFLFQQIVENGISRRDVIAEKTLIVEDTKRTELHRKEVAQKVEPILTVTEDEFIKNNLSSFKYLKPTLKVYVQALNTTNAVPSNSVHLLQHLSYACCLS